LVFFTSKQVEAGWELTYDYGAAGSAGGNSRDENLYQENPVFKTPRISCGGRSVESRPEERASHIRAISSRNEEAPQTEEDEQKEGRIAGDSNYLTMPDEKPSAPSLRRKCLCGSQNCRGLLPCNRAIL